MDAQLEAFERVAYDLYLRDELDAAMRAVTDAFESAGWTPGLWTEFYNALQCDYDARNASKRHEVDQTLSIELRRDAPPEMLRRLSEAALQARQDVRRMLRVELARPVLVTVFLPDAPVDFIAGSYGYVQHKVGLDKICLPDDCVQTDSDASDALLHEFAHTAAFELAGDDLPRWLDEGVATYLSGDFESEEVEAARATMDRAGFRLSVGNLEHILTTADLSKDDPDLVSAAYALAANLVGVWAERFGLESVRGALAAIGQGSSVSRAVRDATGLDLRKIERIAAG